MKIPKRGSDPPVFWDDVRRIPAPDFVRPTREEIMDVVVETRGRWSLLQDDIESRIPMPEFDQMVADALLNAFWPGAVSDSQPVRPTRESAGDEAPEAVVTVRQLKARIAQLEAELDEAQLRSIEARNPGIDMDEVRRSRAGVAVSDSQETPEEGREK